MQRALQLFERLRAADDTPCACPPPGFSPLAGLRYLLRHAAELAEGRHASGSAGVVTRARALWVGALARLDCSCPPMAPNPLEGGRVLAVMAPRAIAAAAATAVLVLTVYVPLRARSLRRRRRTQHWSTTKPIRL